MALILSPVRRALHAEGEPLKVVVNGGLADADLGDWLTRGAREHTIANSCETPPSVKSGRWQSHDHDGRASFRRPSGGTASAEIRPTCRLGAARAVT